MGWTNPNSDEYRMFQESIGNSVASKTPTYRLADALKFDNKGNLVNVGGGYTQTGNNAPVYSQSNLGPVAPSASKISYSPAQAPNISPAKSVSLPSLGQVNAKDKEQVKKLQAQLNSNGAKLSIDGILGNKTKAALDQQYYSYNDYKTGAQGWAEVSAGKQSNGQPGLKPWKTEAERQRINNDFLEKAGLRNEGGYRTDWDYDGTGGVIDLRTGRSSNPYYFQNKMGATREQLAGTRWENIPDNLLDMALGGYSDVHMDAYGGTTGYTTATYPISGSNTFRDYAEPDWGAMGWTGETQATGRPKSSGLEFGAQLAGNFAANSPFYNQVPQKIILNENNQREYYRPSGQQYDYYDPWNLNPPGGAQAAPTPQYNVASAMPLSTSQQTPAKLSVGSRGSDVKGIQNQLNALGAGLKVDGIWGSKTEEAYNKYFGGGSMATTNPASYQSASASYSQPGYNALPPNLSVGYNMPSEAELAAQAAAAVNPQYDAAIAALEQQYTEGQADIDRSAMQRGMGRSSYVTDANAHLSKNMADVKSRKELERQQALAGLIAQRRMEAQQFGYQANVQNNAYAQWAYEMQRQNELSKWEQDYQMMQWNAQQAKKKSGGGSRSSSSYADPYGKGYVFAPEYNISQLENIWSGRQL